MFTPLIQMWLSCDVFFLSLPVAAVIVNVTNFSVFPLHFQGNKYQKCLIQKYK